MEAKAADCAGLDLTHSTQPRRPKSFKVTLSHVESFLSAQ